jgi:hypothetical protein
MKEINTYLQKNPLITHKESSIKKEKTHHDGYSEQYNEYLPLGKRKLYDYNEIGIDYPDAYKEEKDPENVFNATIDDSSDSISSSNSSDSDTIYLQTV